MFTRTLISLSLIFLATLSSIQAQTNWQKYSHVKDIKFSSIPQLANAITAGLESDQEKVEAIYFWVTNNIAYDYKKFLKNKEREKKKKPPRYTGAALSIKEGGMVLSTLKSSKGVSPQHYALVLRDLCKKVGIQVEVVEGYGKSDPLKTKSTGEKHAWNAVRLDAKWHLLDPTWGSGFIIDSERFVPLFNGDYAFVDPVVFDMNHFPKDIKWQLSQTRIDRTFFRSQPVIGAGYLRYKVSNLIPQENIIEAIQGDTITIQFQSVEEILEIKCRNIKSNEEVVSSLERDNDNYKILVATTMLKSGNFSFFNKGKLLFAYRINIGRNAGSVNRSSGE